MSVQCRKIQKKDTFIKGDTKDFCVGVTSDGSDALTDLNKAINQRETKILKKVKGAEAGAFAVIM